MSREIVTKLRPEKNYRFRVPDRTIWKKNEKKNERKWKKMKEQWKKMKEKWKNNERQFEKIKMKKIERNWSKKNKRKWKKMKKWKKMPKGVPPERKCPEN